MLKRKSRTLAINAVFLGLLIASMCLALIPVAGAGLAVITLIVIVVASQIEGYKTSIFMGFSFGLISFLMAFISASPTAPIFRNPLVSLLPRIFIAFLGLLVFNGTKKVIGFIENKSKSGKKLDKRLVNLISSALGSAFTALFNTLFVLVMIFFLYYGKDVGGTAISTEFIMGLVSINFAIEIVGTTLIAPPIVLVVGKYVQNIKMTVADGDNGEDMELLEDIGGEVEMFKEEIISDKAEIISDYTNADNVKDGADEMNDKEDNTN